MMKAKATKAIEIERSTLEDLRARLRGPALLPSDPGYDDARAVWNAMIDRRPALIARCLGVADVVTCVNFAREHGLTLCIKGGGHNISGLAVCDGGLMLDMSLMRGVWVDPAARTACAQAGCLLGDVDRETQVHGLAAVLGFVSNTGMAGLTELTGRFCPRLGRPGGHESSAAVLLHCLRPRPVSSFLSGVLRQEVGVHYRLCCGCILGRVRIG
jgi:hypothetical protein